jgi:two-component system, OmpR family, sensor histidine kinase BaeS
MHDHHDHRGWHGPPGPFVRRRLLFGGLFFVVLAATVGVVGGLVVAAVTRPGPWLLILLVPFFALLAFGRHTIGRTLRPVGALIDATVRVGDGESGVRVEEGVPGPLRPVISSFNRMAQRLDEEDERRRRFLSDIGHELKTPLTVLRGEIEALIDGVRPPNDANLQSLIDDVETVERLADDLRTLTLTEAGRLDLHPEMLDLGRLVEDALASADRMIRDHGVVLDFEASGNTVIPVDEHRMRQVMWNLVSNALRAMPDGGALIVRIQGSAGTVTVSVQDTGGGIDPAHLDTLFERFVKSADSSGSGLGLTIVRDLVQAHGGTVRADNVGNGARFLIVLPRSPD